MRLYVPKFGSVKKIGDFTMLFSDLPNVSNYEWTIDPNNPNKFIVKKSSPTDSSSTNRKNNVNKN